MSGHLSKSSLIACLAFLLSLPAAAQGGRGSVEKETGPEADYKSVSQHIRERRPTFDFIQLPSGYRIEKVAGGFTYATGMTWDDRGNLYVSESGGGMAPFMIAPPRIVRVEPDGGITEVVNLQRLGVHSPVNDVTWHNGVFYISHRLPDLSGAVSRVAPDGRLETLVRGLPSWFEHQTNEITFGPNGRMYIAQGPPTNSGVVGPDIEPWVKARPDGHMIPCQDIVLTGQNFKGPNFLTDAEGDSVWTGAFVPYGTRTEKGQRVAGSPHCGGAVLSADPDGSDLRVHAWGFRNIFGIGFSADGQLYALQNGMDMRGLRPAEHDKDALYRVRQGAWYGWPDYTGELKPITMMTPPDSMQAPGGKTLQFVIDRQASGLKAPDRRLLVAAFTEHSSTNKFDFAPASWGACRGHVMAAQWGDLGPSTSPMHQTEALGYKVVMVHTGSGKVQEFARNKFSGPGSLYGMAGLGLERPIEVRFGRDGAMYVLDFGIAQIDLSKDPPYVYPPETGMVWKITRTGAAPSSCEGLPAQGGHGGKQEGAHKH